MKKLLIQNIKNYIKYTRPVQIHFFILFIIMLLDTFFQKIPIASLFLSCFFTLFILLLIRHISLYLMQIIAIFFVFINSIAFYIINILGYPISYTMIPILIVQTSITEVKNFITLPIIFAILSFFLLQIFIWRNIFKIKKPSFSLKENFLFIIIIAILIKIFSSLVFSYEKRPVPYSYIQSWRVTKSIIREIFPTQKEKDYSDQINYIEKSINIYVIIGESVRADHLSLNGYSRQTNPLLQKEDIINFGISKSCGNLTYISWIYLFSRSICSEEAFSIQQKRIPYYFNQKGFSTLFIGQKDETSLYKVIKEVDIKKSSEDYFSLDNGLKDLDITIKRKLFILNSAGSHVPYNRINLQLNNFEPYPKTESYSDLIKNNISNIVNKYDSTILFLDFEIYHIIQKLKQSTEPVLLLYTSDHGQHLNEKNNLYGHSTKVIEDYMVPLFVWVNEAFKKQYVVEYKNLLINSKKYKHQLSHEVVWHTIMDIGGFSNKDPRNPIINYSRSLLRKELQPQQNKNWFVVNYKRN